MDSVPAWLQDLGLERYTAVFAENDVDAEALRLLSENDLEKLGVSLGHRKRLLKAIAELNGLVAPVPQPAVAPTGSRESDTDAAPAVVTTEAGERRQLTVLFCDMVGFTELANRVDPEILQKIIRAYEDACAVCITRYEGYVFQRLGDGIVAFFGYPLAHEGEAERAIRAGLEIIDALSNLDVPDAGHLAVRIGIATGLVVVSSAEKGAVGETMNIASRLQGIAPVGSIVVSERVQRLAGGSFDYEDLGEQTLKGIARPTHAYCILGVSQAASRFEAAHGEAGLTPLVGREQEIGLLLERWALAQDGEGQVVLLSGEPGIGKSRILSALRERLEATGAQTLRFQCSPYYVNSAFWPSIDNFERALKFGRHESPESKLDKLEALVVGHYGRPLGDVRFIASILSIPCEERYGAISMTPQKHKDETLRTLVDLTEAAARKQPSVMLFEDLHWADPTMLEVLELLIDRVRSIPLLIVLTHRPEFQSRWGAHGHVTGLNLSKLTRAQSSAMVSKLAGSKALPAELLGQILAKTDGVPLFVEELTKAILESGELKDAGDRYEYVGSAHTVTIPATLRDSLMARLDRFMLVKEIAQIGAAIGREFSYELFEAVAPRTKSELDSALQQLTDSGLAFRRGTPPDAVYTFKHALVQDAAYDSLLKSRRQELHGKIARVIEERFPNIKETEPEVLAQHFSRAGLSEQAIGYWLKSGERAIQRSAYTEAIENLRNGLELLETLPDTPERARSEERLRRVLGPALLVSRGYAAPEVEATFMRSRELCEQFGDVSELFLALRGLWAVHLVRASDLRRAREMGQELIDMAGMVGSAGYKLEAHRCYGMSMLYLGDFTAARTQFEQGLALYDPEQHRDHVFRYGNDPAMVCLSYGAHALWMLGYADQALTQSHRGLALARSLAHPFSEVQALAHLAMTHLKRREPHLVGQYADEAIAGADEHGFPFWSATCEVLRGWALTDQGQHEEGLAHIRHGIDAYRATGGGVLLTWFTAQLGEACGKAGKVAEGLGHLDEALALVETSHERYVEAELQRLKGVLQLVAGGTQAAAEQCFQQSLDISRSQRGNSWELRTATDLARLWGKQGRVSEARELLRPIYDWFTEGFNTRDLKEAKALLVKLS